MYKSILQLLLFCISVKCYGEGSLSFTENKGQWEPHILYRADLQGGQLFAERDGLTYLLWDHLPHPGNEAVGPIQFHALRLKFIQALSSPAVTPSGRQGFYSNYFIGNDPSRWAGNVPSYARLSYKQIYPDIDLQLYSTGLNVKYDLIVYPGADPSLIRMNYEGANRLFLSGGALYISTSVNTLVEQQPYAYQIIEKDTVSVPCFFSLTKGVLSYSFPKGYNKEYTLVIDPTLIFSSFTGSLADNFGYTATYDTSGNLYTGGTAFSFGYPTTTGAFQQGYGGGNHDIVLSKFSSDGSTLLYSTYLGGSGVEEPHSLVVNNQDQLIVLGRTNSLNFPASASAYDNTCDSVDLILSRFSTNGTALLASTFIGGSGKDGINISEGPFIKAHLKFNYGDDSRSEVIVDELDQVYVVSCTRSPDFPVSPGAFQPVSGGLQDACLFKFDMNFSNLIWSTYLGGSGNDGGYALVLDPQKNIYVTGGTESVDFPALAGLDATYNGAIDGYVACLNPTASALLFSTFTGTQAYDQSFFIQLDADENVYITGQTSGNYPVTAGVYSNPDGKQFIQKLNKQLNTLLVSTIFGSGRPVPDISPAAFLVDNCSRIYVSGWGATTVGSGNTTGLPVTSDAFKNSTDGNDFYFIVFDPDAAQLRYATFFGGNLSGEHVDGGTSRFDKKGILYQSVCAGCGGHDDFPTTPGVVSNTNNSSNCNNAVIKFGFNRPAAAFDVQPKSGCFPLTVNFDNQSPGGMIYSWDFGNGDTDNSENPAYTYSSPGEYTIRLIVTDPDPCNGTDTAYQSVKVFDTIPHVNVAPDTFLCKGDSYQLSTATADPYLTYSWQPPSGLSDPSIPDPVATPASSITYILTTSASNCFVKDTVMLQVDTFQAAFTVIEDSCRGFIFDNQSGPGSFVKWYFGDGDSSDTYSPEHNYQQSGDYDALLIAGSEKCPDTAIQTVHVEKNPDSEIPTLPNVFTPNGDGKNDRFKFVGNEKICRIEHLVIFSRWGEKLFEATLPDDISWDGKANGKLMPEGTYYYIAEGKDFRKAGTLTLKL